MTRRALVLGLGRFGGGLEATRFLLRHGWQVRVADRAGAETLTEAVEALRDTAADLCLAREDAALLEDVDTIVVNPAIPEHHPLLQEARRRGLRTTQEVELFLEHYPGRVVLVTGTNGKSSTTVLCTQALRACGIDTLQGGNIGHSLLADEATWTEAQVAVLETSSFQLERLDPERHRVAVTVVTRVTSDHLDRHGSLDAYRATKARAPLMADELYVHPADDAVAIGFDSAAPRAVHGPDRGDEIEAWEDAGWLVTSDGRVVHRDAMTLVGAPQQENARAATLVARHFANSTPTHGISTSGTPTSGDWRHRVGLALALARPLRWRLRPVGRLDDHVTLWDNAVSTVAESTLDAIRAIGGTVHWVGGGKSKSGPEALPPFAADVMEHAASIHLFGSVAEALAGEIRNLGGRVTQHERLEGALDAARRAANLGEHVLFSPAFASFDQFANFRQRAEAFERWFASLQD